MLSFFLLVKCANSIRVKVYRCRFTGSSSQGVHLSQRTGPWNPPCRGRQKTVYTERTEEKQGEREKQKEGGGKVCVYVCC